MIPGFTSTASKRPEALFGHLPGGPRLMTRAEGCRLWDAEGREYIDTAMALGAVALGYAHPVVTAAAQAAVRDGVVGSLAPVLEGEVAERLASMTGHESVRFLKSGAEAVAAAVRIARTFTGRDMVVTCGYHGWLDWCQEVAGVPADVKGLRVTIPFDNVAALRAAVAPSRPIAAIVVEPVIDGPPGPGWLGALRETATRLGAILVFDEIKTGFRLAAGGAAERYGVKADLSVFGKALGNGFPIAAVCGPSALMDAATRTFVSSTLATEFVSLAAARAVMDVFEKEGVAEHLRVAGNQFIDGLKRLAARYPNVVAGVRGIPEMCYLACGDEHTSAAMAVKAAERGLVFKRTAYNFVSLAHTETVIDEVLVRLDAALDEVERTC